MNAPLALAAMLVVFMVSPDVYAQEGEAAETTVQANVGLAPIFAENMVLQRGSKINIWGNTAPGEMVSVALDRQRRSVRAGQDGRWETTLSHPKAGGPYVLEAKSPSFQQRISNVMIGEVWLCSGQSNMGFKYSTATDLLQPAPSDDQLRLMRVDLVQSEVPLTTLKTTIPWSISHAETAKDFSAVCHQFGSVLREKLKVPVGLITSAWGGSRIAPFIDENTLKARNIMPPFDPNIEARQNGARAYNGMIAPLVPFSMRGAIWYQGESDARAPEPYENYLHALATSWRTKFGQNWPMLIVQLPAYDPTPREKTGSWARIREAQRLYVKNDRNSALIAQIDQGSAKELHPPEKKAVANRVADAALANVYKFRGATVGPQFLSAKRRGNVVRIMFKSSGAIQLADSATLSGFELCSEDCIPVSGQLTGKREVTLHVPEGQSPTCIRYGWSDVPKPVLFDGSKRPAEPFMVALVNSETVKTQCETIAPSG